MTKKERVRAAFHNLETDHVPVCFWKHVPQELWQEDKFIDAQVDFYRKTDVDFVKLSADGYFGWPAPELLELDRAEDLYKMEALGPDPDHAYQWAYQTFRQALVEPVTMAQYLEALDWMKSAKSTVQAEKTKRR